MSAPAVTGKIKTLEEAAADLAPLRKAGRKIVHCHGVFDLLHIGHLRHLQSARKLGDLLVVTVTPDRFVNKGPDRPAFPEALRAEALAMLECVDMVAINRWPSAVETIQLLKPDFYVKGSEYRQAAKDVTGGILREQQAVESAGGCLAFTDDITFSSSSLINRHFATHPKKTSDYLVSFAKRHPIHEVTGYLQAARDLKVLLVGEAIIDEYDYCETMGKSGKEPMLAARHLRTERFAGGSLAAANHLASFCDHVHLLTCLGTVNSHEDFIRSSLNPRIQTTLVPLQDEPTIVKRRFVEHYPFQKMFEVYEISDKEGHEAGSRQLCAKLEELLPLHDLVLALDYGHGMLDAGAVKVLADGARLLAVNTQVNAHNRGFNTISKYPRADYICISEDEIRFDCRTRRQDLRQITQQVAQRLDCPRATITRGSQGCLCYDRQHGFSESPAFTSHLVDRVGAGDAVFAVTSLCVAQNAPMEVVGFTANIVGAHAVGMVASQRTIGRVPLIKHIETILK
ncbi:MAG: PfkB family carbohydrate kinase [Verrucomicrobiota bacterium]|jgi:rfaE bifunctional protein nucleotidyltransferase chain/domain